MFICPYEVRGKRSVYLQAGLRLEYSTCCHSRAVIIFYRSLAIGTQTGYKLFSLSSVEQLDQVHGSGKCVWEGSQGHQILPLDFNPWCF